ncbi:stemmadenine O-acetyltransferase-like [Spinacia oleracea]|uniref:Stemmadenine O-acetyltransferase-like n=1 Tax=Spinacia oleracea TaxID=3562 RepID=A0A9R0IMC7_SPIOL|nr:stemmadenine O-acetyltransferase-like [Spinacia oleracea]
MEKIREINVRIVSREAVKPSIPTASHLKNLKMCYTDQMLPLVPPFLTSGLVFYTNTNDVPVDITRLKTSLSKTLTTFYPLAGRIKQSTINCNDQGVPFIETRVNCPLSLVINSPKIVDFVTKFLPPRDSLGSLIGCDNDELELELELVHLAIQVNVFTCGGVAIGWYDIHKVMDGTSSATFFKHWAALARQQSYCYDGLTQANFDAAVTAFPPSPKAELLKLGNDYDIHDNGHGLSDSSTVVKSFIFTNNSVTKLKDKASSKQVPNPTRYQALAGFIWEQLLLISSMHYEHNNTDTILQVTVDMRPFTNPPLPRGSIGNLINTAVARAQNSTKLPQLVQEIHGVVSKMKDEINKYHDDDKPAEAVRESWDNLINTLSEYKDRAYKVVSWCKLGFNDLDFGFGKPQWMVPTDGIMSPFHKNLIILTDFKDSDGEGIEAWFFLEDKDMNILESNPQFLAFASPL